MTACAGQRAGEMEELIWLIFPVNSTGDSRPQESHQYGIHLAFQVRLGESGILIGSEYFPQWAVAGCVLSRHDGLF